MSIVRTFALAGAVVVLAPSPERGSALPSSEAMMRAANSFVSSLAPEQRAKAVFAFSDAERLNWHFIPRERRGLPLKEMTPPQRELAKALLQSGVGQRGLAKANAIIDLENVLREEGGSITRDPELYFFSIFGTPAAGSPWGFRFEGHHLSVNFTLVDGKPIATAPSFFGANPAEVRTGTRRGQRALAAEEDLARKLVNSLDEAQRAVAVIATTAPREIVTANTLDINPLSPVGIPISQLQREQSAMLVAVLDEYLARMAEDVARERRGRLERTDFSRVTFAWAGSLAAGGPHYYRIQGPTFLIEYDNTQTNANHIHSVWRDFAGDFGRDLLREHYRQAPHPR